MQWQPGPEGGALEGTPGTDQRFAYIKYDKSIAHRGIALAAALSLAPPGAAIAQDMMRHVDLASPEMVSAEMTRDDLAAMVRAAAGKPLDLTGKRLSGLDLAGFDLKGANLRLARLNRTRLAGADLSGAVLDQAWLLDADLSGAKLAGASLFASQARGARLQGADLSGRASPPT